MKNTLKVMGIITAVCVSTAAIAFAVKKIIDGKKGMYEVDIEEDDDDGEYFDEDIDDDFDSEDDDEIIEDKFDDDAFDE